jgi:hypothetical protein
VIKTIKSTAEKVPRTYFIRVTSDLAEVTFQCDQASVKCLRVERIKLASGAEVEQTYTSNRIKIDDGEIIRPRRRGDGWMLYCEADDHTIWRRPK